MKKVKKLCCVSLATLMIIHTTLTSFAITTLSVPHYQQEKSNWCWAAAARMVGKYKTPASTKTQTQIVTYVKGSPTDNTPGSLLEIVSATEYASNFAITGGIYFFTLSFANIKNRINGNMPIQPLVRGNGTGHYYVIYGYHSSSSGNYVYLIDPGDALGKYVSYNDFKNGTWTETRPWKETVTFSYREGVHNEEEPMDH